MAQVGPQKWLSPWPLLTRVPIVRVFDRRQPRFRNIGLLRYEAIAELQRE